MQKQIAYREVLAIDPFFVLAILNLGTSLVHQDKYEEAMQYFEKVLEFGDDNERSSPSAYKI